MKTFEEWAKENNFAQELAVLGAKEAWDYRQKEIDKLKSENDDLKLNLQISQDLAMKYAVKIKYLKQFISHIGVE